MKKIVSFWTPSFCYQYISLMSLILTFCIGALSVPPTSPSHQVLDSSNSKVGVSASTAEEGIKPLTFETLFNETDQTIETVKLSSIFQLLTDHDLKANIDVYPAKGSDLLISSLVDRSILLAQELYLNRQISEVTLVRGIIEQASVDVAVTIERQKSQ